MSRSPEIRPIRRASLVIVAVLSVLAAAAGASAGTVVLLAAAVVLVDVIDAAVDRTVARDVDRALAAPLTPDVQAPGQVQAPGAAAWCELCHVNPAGTTAGLCAYCALVVEDRNRAAAARWQEAAGLADDGHPTGLPVDHYAQLVAQRRAVGR